MKSTNTHKPTDIGPNRTGAGASPLDAKRTAEGALAGTPDAGFSTMLLEQWRGEFAKSSPPLGRMPPPASLKGAAKTGMEALKGANANVFLDMLGERLAFERTGTRLYEALLVKFDAAHVHEGGPTRAELEKIRDDELRHFGVLAQAFEKLGADPTAMTPSADLMAVTSMGLVQALSDPRTTLTECLKAILMAELADNDGWAMLAEFADQLGHKDLADDFHACLGEEMEHLENVRRWVTFTTAGQAGIIPKPPARKGAPQAPARH